MTQFSRWPYAIPTIIDRCARVSYDTHTHMHCISRAYRDIGHARYSVQLNAMSMAGCQEWKIKQNNSRSNREILGFSGNFYIVSYNIWNFHLRITFFNFEGYGKFFPLNKIIIDVNFSLFSKKKNKKYLCHYSYWIIE